MTITLVLLSGTLTVLLGRWLFGKWFNHVGLYGSIWSCTLVLFEADLVHFYPLVLETWLFIIAGWIGFVLGSASVVCARFALGVSSEDNEKAGGPERSLRTFTIMLWVLNAIVIFDMIYLIRVISGLIGGMDNFLGAAILLYALRTSGGNPGRHPIFECLGARRMSSWRDIHSPQGESTVGCNHPFYCHRHRFNVVPG